MKIPSATQHHAARGRAPNLRKKFVKTFKKITKDFLRDKALILPTQRKA